MGRGSSGVVLALIASLIICAPTPALAAFKASGESVTHLEWQENLQGEDALPFYEYLRLDLTDRANDQRIVVYGRLAVDILDEIEYGVDSRLYYAYYEKRKAWGDTDIWVGRRWVNTVAGIPIVDGIGIRTRKAGSYLAQLYGGSYVTLEDNQWDEWVWGFSLEDDLWQATDLNLSYLQKWDDGDLAREYIGLSAWFQLPARGSAYGELQYDMLSQIPAYYLAGVRLVPQDRWTFSTEFMGFTPVFDSTDIYSVFAVDEYQELKVTADYRINREWALFGDYTHEFYESFEDADVFEAGAEVTKASGWGGYLVGIYRDGDEDLSGIKANLTAPIPWEIRLDAGFEYNIYSRVEDGEDDDTSASRYWLIGERDIGRAMSLRIKVERVESAVWDYYNQGRISFRYRF